MKDEAEECTNPGTGVKGQEEDQARQLHAVEREGRRKRGVGGPTHYEGQSSDDELLKTNRDKFSAEIGKHCTLTHPFTRPFLRIRGEVGKVHQIITVKVGLARLLLTIIGSHCTHFSLLNTEMPERSCLANTQL